MKLWRLKLRGVKYTVEAGNMNTALYTRTYTRLKGIKAAVTKCSDPKENME